MLLRKIAQICEYDKEQCTWQEMIVLATLKLAIEGKSSALREVWERLGGQVPSPEEEVSYPTRIVVRYVSPNNNPAALSRREQFAGHDPAQHTKVFATNRPAGNRTGIGNADLRCCLRPNSIGRNE